MSTRCQIAFYVHRPSPRSLDLLRVALISRDHDGYPGDVGSATGVLVELAPVLSFMVPAWASVTDREHVETVVARALVSMVTRRDADLARFGLESMLTGYRVTNEWEGRLDYIYCVYRGGVDVYRREVEEFHQRFRRVLVWDALTDTRVEGDREEAVLFGPF
jgi:hypothetical protein